jgi:hypothetical protein
MRSSLPHRPGVPSLSSLESPEPPRRAPGHGNHPWRHRWLLLHLPQIRSPGHALGNCLLHIRHFRVFGCLFSQLGFLKMRRLLVLADITAVRWASHITVALPAA